MAHNSHRTARRVTNSLSTRPSDWGDPVSLDYLGVGGRLARSILRAPASSSVTEVTLRVYQGDYDISTNPGNVPDEDVVWEKTTIAVSGSATAADSDIDIADTAPGAVYDILPFAETSALWCAIKGTAGSATQDDIQWTLAAVDVG